MQAGLTNRQRNWILVALGMGFFFIFLTLLLRTWLTPNPHRERLRQIRAGFEQQFNPYGEALEKIATKNTDLVFEFEKIEQCTHDTLLDQMTERHPTIGSRDAMLATRACMLARIRYNLNLGGDTYKQTGERLARMTDPVVTAVAGAQR